jgi:hydroxylamine reductase
MFCNQCEQTADHNACITRTICGKSSDVADLQDLLTYFLQGLAVVAVEARKKGVVDAATDEFAAFALFSTLTNVNFDPERFVAFINETVERRDALAKKAGLDNLSHGPATAKAASGLAGMVSQGVALKLFAPKDTENEDITSLKTLLLLALRGIAAYADHARVVGKTDPAIYQGIHESLAATVDKDLGVGELVEKVLAAGELNLRTMELLDSAHTTAFGHPVPTKVSLGAKKGKAILISGHDLKDLDELLKQTEGKGINVYTHGEMLPAHGYPGLHKYPHFAGHYGGAWQDQVIEFAKFPGAILMTTNCLQKPRDSYFSHIFTCGAVGWEGVTHIENRDFSPVIAKALELPGFTEDIEGKTVMTGFAHNAVLGVADQVIQGVKSGAIRHFFLVGGCDGADPGRNYYTEFVEQVPEDCIVLTLACGKFRFFDMDLGDIGGIPRLLDVGQCNDAYSAIRIASALAEAFECGVNDLPLSMIITWYEQKAVAILCTLLFLGIKDIRLGPTLPAFITQNVLDVLVKNYNIMPIATPEEDLAAILG